MFSFYFFIIFFIFLKSKIGASYEKRICEIANSNQMPREIVFTVLSSTTFQWRKCLCCPVQSRVQPAGRK